MARPKNNVSITPRNKDKTLYDIWYWNKAGERVKVTASTTTILKGVMAVKGGVILE